MFWTNILVLVGNITKLFSSNDVASSDSQYPAAKNAPVLDIDASLGMEIGRFPLNTIPYVVVRGIVKPLGNPIHSNYNDKITGVIQRLKIKEHLAARTSSGRCWSDETRIIHKVCNSTPFVLSNGNHSVEVIDALAADILDMDVTSDKFEPLSPGVVDAVWGLYSGVKQKGLQCVEEMLREGSYITAVGELSRTQSGALKIQPPINGLPYYITTATKSSLLRKTASSRDFIKILLFLFGTVALATSVRIAYKYLRRRVRRNHYA